MATLAHRLIDAHIAAGLTLTSYYGAGSSGKAMLTVMGIKDQLAPVPEMMKHAVASSFFGGRFENARIGLVPGPVYNYDISSAYPYQTCFLPCLRHMRWSLVKKRREIEGSQCALVHYSLKEKRSDSRIIWGPFPFRDINYPTHNPPPLRLVVLNSPLSITALQSLQDRSAPCYTLSILAFVAFCEYQASHLA